MFPSVLSLGIISWTCSSGCLSPEDEPLINPTSSWSSSGPSGQILTVDSSATQECQSRRRSRVNSVQHFHNCLSALSPERCDFSRTVKFEWNKSSSVWVEVWEHGDWQRHVLYLRENQTGIRPVSCSALFQLAPSFPPPNVTWLLAAGLGDSGTQRLWRFLSWCSSWRDVWPMWPLQKKLVMLMWCEGLQVLRGVALILKHQFIQILSPMNFLFILFTTHLLFPTHDSPDGWSCFKVKVN